FQKLGANGRSHDEHRRIRALHGHGESVDGRSPQGRRFELSSLASLCCGPTIIAARLSDQSRWRRANGVRFAKIVDNWVESGIVGAGCTNSGHGHQKVSHELELKFELQPDNTSGGRRIPRLLVKDLGGPQRVEELESLYFDTPGEELRENGVSLRIR